MGSLCACSFAIRACIKSGSVTECDVAVDVFCSLTLSELLTWLSSHVDDKKSSKNEGLRIYTSKQHECALPFYFRISFDPLRSLDGGAFCAIVAALRQTTASRNLLSDLQRHHGMNFPDRIIFSGRATV
jgi:hypothetical protein